MDLAYQEVKVYISKVTSYGSSSFTCFLEMTIILVTTSYMPYQDQIPSSRVSQQTIYTYLHCIAVFSYLYFYCRIKQDSYTFAFVQRISELIKNCSHQLLHHKFWLKIVSLCSPMQGNYSIQGSLGPTTSPSGLTQLTVESTWGTATRRTDTGPLKSVYTEARASESQNSLAKQIDRKDFQTSLVPTPCRSPPRRSESSQKTPDAVIKAKDLPAHQVPTSINKTSLKEISGEKLRPIPEVAVSGFALVCRGRPHILLCFCSVPFCTHFQQYLFFIIWVISNVFAFVFGCVVAQQQQLLKEYIAHPSDNRMPLVFNEKDNYHHSYFFISQLLLIILVITACKLQTKILFFEPKACQ